jgi:putative nucleotidyltransferase with HDIG domain
MIRVLFVDDEPAVLEGLENRLRRLRHRWQMSFALGSAQALQQLQVAPVDVIVSDMRMPGMDGGQLLDRVREQHPETVRIILSGQTGEDGALRLMPVAHQLLTKPCDAGALERAIECSAGLQSRRERPDVRQALGLLKSLPALPRLYWDLVREIDRSDADSGSIAAIIEQDVAMTARLLQMANSAFFANNRRVRSVKDAVTLLGLLPIRSVVLNLHLFRAMSDICAPKGFSLERLQTHSFKTAQLAAQMVADPEERKTACSAAMLHDVGFLVLAIGMPEVSRRILERARATQEPVHRVEADEIGCDHAEVGAQMLALWGLPLPLVEAVAFHHEPARSGDTRFGATAAVHVACVLASDGDDDPVPAAFDVDFLRRVGVDQLADGWRRGLPITRF